MPIYKYLVLNKSINPEYIEIEQSLKDAPLAEHPLTGEPIQRVPESPSLSLKHSSVREKKILSHENLQKNGFSVLEKDQSTKGYTQTVGKNPHLDFCND